MFTVQSCYYKNMGNLMSKDNVIEFEDARQPHTVVRRDKKLAAMKQAFKAARSDSEPAPKKRRRRKKKK